MWENSFDKLDMFAGTPIMKWKEVVLNGSLGPVHNELERLLEELALYELILEEMSCDVNLREFYYKVKNEDELKAKFNEKKNNIAIESTSKILSESE